MSGLPNRSQPGLHGLYSSRVKPDTLVSFLLLSILLLLFQSDAYATHETLVEVLCADRLAGSTQNIANDSNGDGSEFELASRVICPNQVGVLDIKTDEFGGIFPVDISGVYTQNVPGQYAWLDSGLVTLTLEKVGIEPHANKLLHTYTGTVVFENFSLVSEPIPNVLPFQSRIVLTETYSGSVSGTIDWGFLGGATDPNGLFEAFISPGTQCSRSGIGNYNVQFSTVFNTDGSFGLRLSRTGAGSLPLCSGDCLFDPASCTRRAEIIFPDPIYGAPVPIELFNRTGLIKGQLRAGTAIDTTNGVDIQHATVNLIKQSGYVRTVKKSGETDEEYNAYIAMQDSIPPIKSLRVLPVVGGNFSFKYLPFVESQAAGESPDTPVYYSIIVSKAESDEVFVEDGVTKIESVPFIGRIVRNLKPAEPPGTKEEIFLSRGSLSDAKRFLAEKLSAPPTENNYKPAEIAVIPFLDDLDANPIKQTDETLEGLRRAIWAERVARDGSLFADQLLTLSLAGLGSFIADVYDEFVGHVSKGRSSVEREIKRIEPHASGLNNSAWNLDPDFLKVKTKVNRHLDNLKQRESDAGNIDDRVINLIKSMLVELETALVVTGTIEPETAASIKGNIEKTLVVLLKTLKSGALNGFSKSSLSAGGVLKFLKFLIPIGVNKAKPLLLDNTLLPSYTKFTAPHLKYSADKLVEPWGSHDAAQYKLDRDKVVTVMQNQSNEASQRIQAAQIALGLGEGFDAVEAGAGFISTIPPLKWVKYLEELAKALKFGSNAAVAIVPFKVAFLDIPNFVEEGIYVAFGEVTPSSAAAQRLSVASVQSLSGTTPLTQINSAISSSVSAAATEYIGVFNLLSDRLKANDIGAALELTGGDSAPNYMNRLTEFSQHGAIFITQAFGARRSMTALLDEQMQFMLSEAEVGDALTELYLNILTINYAGPTDSLYVAERNKVVNLIQVAIEKVTAFENAILAMDSALAGLDMLPAVVVQLTSLTSDSTGESVIKASPEIFTLRARVRNISNIPVLSLSAGLTVDSARKSISATPSVSVPISIGTLAADDGADGSGSDERDIEWKLRYDGDLSTEVILSSIEILENGETASSFVTNASMGVLTIDPSIDDIDLDLIPDSLELANGLEVGRDDALDDDDSDGLSNYVEIMLIGTNPQNRDTDGDGLFDGEEATGGLDGYLTDPLNSDTDDDGVLDGVDGQPLDGGTSDAPVFADEPIVALSKTSVVLSKFNPIAWVNVTNNGSGSLSWTALSGNTGVAITTPQSPDLGNGTVRISAPANFDFDIEGRFEALVHVIDVGGKIHDSRAITVVIDNSPVERGCMPFKLKTGKIIMLCS